MAIDLRDLSVSYTDYSDRLNPPILHRKETFLSPNSLKQKLPLAC
jgi:hypothetical protein